jgi:hypothetical protein
MALVFALHHYIYITDKRIHENQKGDVEIMGKREENDIKRINTGRRYTKGNKLIKDG